MEKPQQKRVYNPFAELAEIRHERGDHLGAQEPRHSVPQVPKNSGAKSQNPTFVKLTAYVPKELHLAVKVRLVEQGREISDLVEELVGEWLKRQSRS